MFAIGSKKAKTIYKEKKKKIKKKKSNIKSNIKGVKNGGKLKRQ